jgi:hypothetical protein
VDLADTIMIIIACPLPNAVTHRLAQDFQDVAAELQQLIQP